MALPVITTAQMREWEQASWAAGQTETEVIRKVGLVVARTALALTRANDCILVLAGKGNNGADARACCPHLKERSVVLLELADPAAKLPELDRALTRRPALLIDGLFGIGLNRPLDEAWVEVIRRINAASASVLAVDVPSGLNADSGEPQPEAIRAALTVTVAAPKTGMLQQRAWPYVGQLRVAHDVGLAPFSLETELQWIEADDFREFPPRRPIAGHKGAFGHLAMVAGSFGYHGAAVLSSRGAQRAQPGLITLHTLESVYAVIASQCQAVMVRPLEADTKLPGPWSAILIGPGLAGPEVNDPLKLLVRLLWRDSALPVIVDASAMDWLPLGPTPRNAVRIITPHPGEAGRLLRTTADKIQAARSTALRQISKQLGDCWVVLKGHQTLIGRSTGPILVNSSGNPHLAQGGSGDLLSGFIAGLLAQPALQHDVQQTLSYAVWQHGAAADYSQEKQKNWVVEDLAATLGSVLPRQDDGIV
jgi:ADP-dependent NAD(P)H-hydrate dehydratase / NAD(P)H-hydrate epimerase